MFTSLSCIGCFSQQKKRDIKGIGAPKSTNHFIFGHFHQMSPWQIWAMGLVSPFILIYAQLFGNLHFWGSVLSLRFCLCSTPKEKYSNLKLVFSSFKVRILNSHVFHPWGLSWSLDQLFLKQPPRYQIRAGFRLELFGFFPLWAFYFLWPISVFASKPLMILWSDPKIRTISRVMHPSERSWCPNATPSLITHTSINWMLPSQRNSTSFTSI